LLICDQDCFDNEHVAHIKPLKQSNMGCKWVRQATTANFLSTFVITFGEIFLKYYWNIPENVFKKVLNLKKIFILFY
jgi:hypothetical protein